VVFYKSIFYPIVYLFIYRDIRLKSNKRPYVTHRCLLEILRRRFYKIPKRLHYVIIKDMEELKLIKKEGVTNKIRYEILAKDIDKLLNQYLSIYF